MTKTTAPKIIELPVALHIPVSVLAKVPEKLRVLAETIKTCSKVIGGSRDAFTAAHDSVRKAFDDAYGTTQCIINTVIGLAAPPSDEINNVIFSAARSARSLTSAINAVCGNIHNNDCFKTTFHDNATVNATVNALNACGDEISTVLRPFGY